MRLGLLHGLNALTDHPLGDQPLFEICAQLEGHPDNAAPAAFGGFTIAGGPEVIRFNVDPSLHFVLLIPAFEIATPDARRALPETLPRLAAAASCANACRIVGAFAQGDYRKLRGAFADHLHQPFRKKLIPFLDHVIAAAESAGALGAFLSGSGSTILRNHPSLTGRRSPGDAGRRAQRRRRRDRGQSRCPIINSHPRIPMRRRLENLEQFAIDVILERRHGVRATLLRGVLFLLSFVYERLVQLRLFLYRHRILRERTLGCLVISIGNLTVGGTGKTPSSRNLPARCGPAGAVLRSSVAATRACRAVQCPQMVAASPAAKILPPRSRLRRQDPSARFADRRRRALHAGE